MIQRRPRFACLRTALSPLRGLFPWHFVTHGLRRGLHSFAASRLKARDFISTRGQECSFRAGAKARISRAFYAALKRRSSTVLHVVVEPPQSMGLPLVRPVRA